MTNLLEARARHGQRGEVAGETVPAAPRMYILIRESVPLGFAMVAAAHASLAAYLKYRDAPETAEWLAGPFRKVVCKVSDQEFAAAKQVEDGVALTESALGGQEVAIAFRPRRDWPKAFRFYRLWR